MGAVLTIIVNSFSSLLFALSVRTTLFGISLGVGKCEMTMESPLQSSESLPLSDRNHSISSSSLYDFGVTLTWNVDSNRGDILSSVESVFSS